jgi:hypothetical protein
MRIADVKKKTLLPIFAESRMDLWECLEYAGEALVFIGVVGEVFAGWYEPEKKRLAKASSLVLIVGLALSLAALIKTNEHFNGTIASLNLQSSQANERAAKDEGETAAVKANNLELGIQLAKEEQATADAEKAAAEANAKLGGWKLDDTAKKRFAKQVKKFSGTPFDLAVNPVEAPFMEELDALLTSPSVGWVRLPPKAAETLMAILIDSKASIILSSGIVLEVDQDQIASLNPAINALGTALHKELDLKEVTLHLVPPGSWGRRIHIIIGRRQ